MDVQEIVDDIYMCATGFVHQSYLSMGKVSFGRQQVVLNMRVKDDRDLGLPNAAHVWLCASLRISETWNSAKLEFKHHLRCHVFLMNARTSVPDVWGPNWGYKSSFQV